MFAIERIRQTGEPGATEPDGSDGKRQQHVGGDPAHTQRSRNAAIASVPGKDNRVSVNATSKKDGWSNAKLSVTRSSVASALTNCTATKRWFSLPCRVAKSGSAKAGKIASEAASQAFIPAIACPRSADGQ